MSTLDYKVAYYDRAVDPVFPECRGQKIYIFWHEYILFPLYLRGHCNLAMLLSRHRDAEILSHAAHHLGFEFVRGSTQPRRRGGAARAAAQEPAHAPDDHARRPARPAAAAGPRRDLPGLEAGDAAGGDGLRLRSAVAGPAAWDRFAIPRPCSRARAVVSPRDLRPAGPRPRRHRALSPEDRAAAEPLDRRGRGLGRVGPADRRAAEPRSQRRGATTEQGAAAHSASDLLPSGDAPMSTLAGIGRPAVARFMR